nr:hypothetical protein KitaXyl93_51130 [Kitasatospora sp. Xyl93]
MSDLTTPARRDADRAPAAEQDTAAARRRLARRQEELLAALVAGGPVPPGFDERQVRAQSTGLAAKRRDTTAKVAPDLRRLLGARYGPLFLGYARSHPQTGGYRADARAFAQWALTDGGPLAADHRRALEQWLRPAPARPPGPLARLRRALRRQPATGGHGATAP